MVSDGAIDSGRMVVSSGSERVHQSLRRVPAISSWASLMRKLESR